MLHGLVTKGHRGEEGDVGAAARLCCNKGKTIWSASILLGKSN